MLLGQTRHFPLQGWLVIYSMKRRDTHSLKNKIYGNEGASIVIALVFFLICAVIGSVVLTAASINAKAVVTHRQTQQAEYTVTSAAQTIVDQIVPTTVVWKDQKNPPEIEMPVKGPVLMQQLWTTNLGNLWNVHQSQSETPYTLPTLLKIKVSDSSGSSKYVELEVYAQFSVDRDFNITVKLSSEEDINKPAAYKEVVTVQCIPTYNNAGRLEKCEWKNAVITKASDV